MPKHNLVCRQQATEKLATKNTGLVGGCGTQQRNRNLMARIFDLGGKQTSPSSDGLIQLDSWKSDSQRYFTADSDRAMKRVPTARGTRFQTKTGGPRAVGFKKAAKAADGR